MKTTWAMIGMILFSVTGLQPQEKALPQALASLVEAERAFARLSVERGVRESFLAFFADDGVAFLPNAVNAKQAYGALPAPSVPPEFTLDWAPIYGDVSAAGDLGYSTGPVVRSDNTPKNRPAAHSLFFSVWKRQPGGEWRVAVDLGLELERPYAPLDAPYRRAPQWAANIPKEKDPAASLAEAEREFFKLASSGAAWRSFLREDALVYRSGRMPMSGKDLLGLPAMPFSGETVKAESARSGELGYSYGTYSSAAGEKGYYVRVWKRDPQGRWRIVFDLSRALPAVEKK